MYASRYALDFIEEDLITASVIETVVLNHKTYTRVPMLG
jgi:hypothetical protein